MPRQKLTDASVKALAAKPPKIRTDYFDTILEGFGLRVSPSGTGSWFLFYRVDALQVRDTIARYPAKGLAAARQAAKDKLDLLGQGKDPRTEDARQRAQEARRRAETFGAVAHSYKTEHLDKLRRGGEAWAALEADFLQAWRDLPVRSIDRRMVKSTLSTVESERGPYARNRRLALVRNLFNFALDDELVDANPASRIKMLPETARDRVLSDAELVEVWQAAGELLPTYGALVRFLIVTGQRRGECAGATWPEISDEGTIWTIPAERMKAALIHEVPLAPLAQSLLPARDGRSWIFASPKRRDAPIGGFADLKSDIDAKILAARQRSDPKANPMSPWRFHDLRRTMRSGLSRLRVPSEIAERVIGHVPGGIRRVYDRFEYRDEKRDALQRWAAYVDALVNPAPKVTDIEFARQARDSKKP